MNAIGHWLLLVEALETDIEWREMHTRPSARTQEWIDASRDRSFLLRGRDLQSAEDWYARKGEHKENRPTTSTSTFRLADASPTGDSDL